jgi:hypothetical protein
VYGAIALTLVGLLMLLAPRFGDHRSRLRQAARQAASAANPERWRGEPTTPARHRASGGKAAQPAIPAIMTVPAAENDKPGAVSDHHRTLSG